MAPGVARHYREILREHIDNLALALVAPLGADDDHSFPFFQIQLHWNGLARPLSAANAGSHTLVVRAQHELLNYKDLCSAEVYPQ